jgi:glycosyltransferase involved in cell wall biosynthesis
MKISYAILTHNEGEYIEKLLTLLTENKRPEDEIVIVDDYSDDQLTKDILKKFQNKISIYVNAFKGDAEQKNFLNRLCTGDYILQLDADELMMPEFIEYLPEFLSANPEVDLYILPRINTVEGLTEEHIKRWGWNVNDKQWVNWPDWQMRLYRNSPDIKWEGLLHSKIIGMKQYAYCPPDETFAILHHKQIERQEAQNNLYDKIEQNGRTKYKV